jgi:hypothetical protein
LMIVPRAQPHDQSEVFSFDYRPLGGDAAKDIHSGLIPAAATTLPHFA